MTVAYFDCFAGAAGDMIVGSLLDAGAELAPLRASLARLGVGGYSLSAESVKRGGIGGVKFHVTLAEDGHHEGEHHHEHRNLRTILDLIAAAELPERAADRAARVFRRLAEAEAKVHRVGVDEVHFHEVGAVDSIVDIVGACLALEQLGVDRVLCSPIAVGQGTMRCAHGVMPIPAPATAELLRGARTRPTGIEAEATTPTGAAILTALWECQGPLPAMEVSAVGYGAGTRESEQMPNLVRVFVGQAQEDASTADALVELSANIDDCTGELIGAAIERLLEAGCADAWAAPIVMKKSRPAWMLSALCTVGDAAEAQRILFAETTTFGVRRRPCERAKLARTWVTVETPYGPVRVKEGRADGRLVSASPEFADCQAAAGTHHVPVKEVFAAAQAEWRRECGA